MLTKTSKKIVIIFLLFTVAFQTVKAQDFLLSQFYANPLYLNPALAGSIYCPRVSLGFRDQWPSVPGSFVTFTASYDQYVEALSGGVGLIVANDQAGAFRTTMASLMYSYRLKVSKGFFINAALKASFVNNYLDWDQLRFGDEIQPGVGFVHVSSAQKPDQTNIFYPDFGVGIAGYSEYFYAGLAVDHLTQPSHGFYGVDNLPMKFTVHAGGLLNVASEKRRTSPLGIKSAIISPNIIFQHVANVNYFNYGIYLDFMPIIFGTWFRHGLENPDAIVLLIGLKQPSFKVGYSYDITISNLAGSTGGAHEVSLAIQFPCADKKKKSKKASMDIECPVF